MDNRKLGILAIVAAVMVLWAALQSHLASRTVSRVSGPSYLIQGLDPADIGKIVVGAADDALTIERREGKFVVVDEAGYPADPEQINDLITKSLDVKTTETYTDNAKNHEELEVTEETARHVVKFFKGDGKLLTGLVIGKSQEAGQSSFVRLASDDTVYLAESVPWFRSRAIDYVEQQITSVNREDVNSVTVTTPDGSYRLISKDKGDSVAMADPPDGKELKESDAKSTLTALISMRFDDVNRPSEIEGLEFDHRYVCLLNDSTEYRLELAKKDDKTYMRCSAAYTDPTPVTKKLDEVDSEEVLKEKEAKLLAQERAQKFTLRHKGWVYEIPDWKAKYLTKPKADLLEDKEPPAEEEEESAATESPIDTPPAEPNAVGPVPEPNSTSSTSEPNDAG
jgi:hypothetical protein